MSEIEIELYEHLGRSKHQWLHTGKLLIAASNILYTESDKASDELTEFLEKAGSASDDEFIEARAFIPARMLTAMALENLIKGLIIIKHQDMVSKDRKFALNSHYLLQLLTTYLPEIALGNKEKEILKEMENYIFWKGRYPIPLVAKDFKPHPVFENETTIINGLCNKLLKAYS